MPRPFRRLPGLIAALTLLLAIVLAAGAGAAGAATRHPHSRHHLARVAPRVHVLRVGTYHGVAGQYTDLQAAIDAARPGDWILVAPGDYREAANQMLPGAKGDDRAGAGFAVTTPGIHIRGMDRNTVVLDGTKAGAPQCSSAEADQSFGPNDAAGSPSGRNGLIVFKASGVSVENLTVCNFLTGDSGGGNQVWFDGGGATGQQKLGAFRGSYLSATDTFYKDNSSPAGGYGIYSSNTYGPGVFAHDYASNFNDSAYYVGACPDCGVTLDDIHAEYSALGYSGTDSGGHILIEHSEFDNNQDGFDTNSQNNDDAPPPQDGKCPGTQVGPTEPTVQRIHSCWIFVDNYVHDNNNPNVPAAGVAAAGPLGTGMSISGGRHDVVVHNRFVNNNAWGLVLVPYPDTEQPPAISNCQGGANLGTPAQPACYFDDWGNEIADNTFTHNGSYGNQTNGDMAELSGDNPNSNPDSNCFHDNVDTAGPLTTSPSDLNTRTHCGSTYPAEALLSPFGVQVSCDSELLGPCPSNAVASYPRATHVVLPPLAPQKTMPNVCGAVPGNPWCPRAVRARAKKVKARRHRARGRR